MGNPLYFRPIYRNCEVCGKRFLVPSGDYVYKRRIGNLESKKFAYFCGWNHMRQWDDEQGKAGRKHRKRNRNADWG